MRYFRKLKFLARNAQQFIDHGGEVTKIFLVFDDIDEDAGVARGHYFHQDLLIASRIFTNNPVHHIDIGSRIDGFVAHVASFRPIEVWDLRPLRSSTHQNIDFKQVDVMNIDSHFFQTVDSISCLHAIEHFGLGRYGDSVNPLGYKIAISNIISMLKIHGYLYISFPIGNVNEVNFNAHRIFSPLDIFNWSDEMSSLTLKHFDLVNDEGDLIINQDINNVPFLEYGCGIYTFIKNK